MDQDIKPARSQYQARLIKPNNQGVMLNKQFNSFIQDNQFLGLVEFHPLTSTATDRWQQQVLVFYDMLIEYFLKNNPHFVLLQEDALKLEIKQYYISNPVEMQVLNIKDNVIQEYKIGLYYNRQLNVYGFIVPTPNGRILRGKYQQMRNYQLNLFEYQDDPVHKYKDNRIIVINTLIHIKQPIYDTQMSKIALSRIQQFRLDQIIKQQLIYKIINDIPLQYELKEFVTVIAQNNPDINFLLQTQGSIVYANTNQILQYLNRLGIFHLFIRFINQMATNSVVKTSNVVIQSTMNKIIDRNISLSQNYDLNFDLRALQYLYKQSFGFNEQVRNTKTPEDFYATIPSNLIVIMQEKLQTFKQSKVSKCAHMKTVQDLYTAVSQNEYAYAFNIIMQIIETYAKNVPLDQQIQINIGQQPNLAQSVDNRQEATPINDSTKIVPIQSQDSQNKIVDQQQHILISHDLMYCRQCQQSIICYHELLNILKYIEKLPLEYYDQVVQQFLVRDLQIFQFSSFCQVCGGAFPIKLELQQIYENIDPLKKYNVIKKTFKILFGTIITSFQFPMSYFINDFIQQYYYPMKQELLQFKHQSNYAQRKQKLVALFVSSYIYSLKGDNVAIDLKTMYKYAQQGDITYDQFINTLGQLQDKFKIQSSIIIPSLVTVKHLYNNLINKPIIGNLIKNDPIRLSTLLQQKLPLYPTLYEMDKFIPLFNVDIKTLSPQVISRVLDTAAVDILNRKSSVVQKYIQVKKSAGRYMERNSTSYSNRHVVIDHYRYKDIPNTFIIENYKTLFYDIICPVTKLQHVSYGKCSKCEPIDLNKVSNQQFHSLFFKINNLQLNAPNKYPDIQPIGFPFKYSNSILYNISKEYLVHQLQVQNFGGFSYIEARAIQQFNTLELLVTHQMEVYQKIYKSFTYSTISNNDNVPVDLQFVLKYDYNWNLYQCRLNTILNRIKIFLAQFNTLSATIQISQTFDIASNTLRQGGTKNIFIQCQVVLFHFFDTILNQLKQHVNEGILKQKMKELFKEDITRIDQYSVNGSFRHKTVKEIDAEAIQAEIQENMVQHDPYLDLDDDNDLVESMKKNTLDEDDYDESFRN